ncbi:MAG TPA: N-acetyltransferase [Bryobacteraceae bacterium]|nr:N-acetyltransferase [Bryobacteraceae bacterium]
MASAGIHVRAETPADRGAICAIQEAAFGRPDEAELVEALRSEGAALLSLLAEWDGLPAGHVLFSRMWIESSEGRREAVALAPVAVLPERQRQGIGGELIRKGLDRLRGAGEGMVLVLGDAEYYSRFGFSSEAARNLASPFPAEHFMAMELTPGALTGVSGRVRYARAFGL